MASCFETQIEVTGPDRHVGLALLTSCDVPIRPEQFEGSVGYTPIRKISRVCILDDRVFSTRIIYHRLYKVCAEAQIWSHYRRMIMIEILVPFASNAAISSLYSELTL